MQSLPHPAPSPPPLCCPRPRPRSPPPPMPTAVGIHRQLCLVEFDVVRPPPPLKAKATVAAAPLSPPVCHNPRRLPGRRGAARRRHTRAAWTASEGAGAAGPAGYCAGLRDTDGWRFHMISRVLRILRTSFLVMRGGLGVFACVGVEVGVGVGGGTGQRAQPASQESTTPPCTTLLPFQPFFSRELVGNAEGGKHLLCKLGRRVLLDCQLKSRARAAPPPPSPSRPVRCLCNLHGANKYVALPVLRGRRPRLRGTGGSGTAAVTHCGSWAAAGCRHQARGRAWRTSARMPRRRGGWRSATRDAGEASAAASWPIMSTRPSPQRLAAAQWAAIWP